VMNLILRLYEAGSGQILCDGQDIATVGLASLRQQIGYVAQENFLFKGSVRDNIAMGRPGASEDQIVAAAKAAYAHDFILGFERGYDSPCGEHGMQLSGGQRQRVAVARALVNNTSILLAAEPTGALDTATGTEIMALFERLYQQGNTIVLVTHEHDIALHAHRVIHIRDGKVEKDEKIK